ncbi:membrane-spanning 4-domains subfamily A member 8-like isoform X1 [Meles meles]|uniref:membrane-spanning 4-domains subfamily A member 8-like isoform X1 n=1 Tax=Meles meles TaxID=9662 RepID=UPI001E69AA26|nr:membrane-spanning 4-domains subfamily A member 8-like isoform X1 [Meles meles]XP_045873562.1 membrane-spanning 4-domains subfamily A member 8-like isoform X1 [Meles meles]
MNLMASGGPMDNSRLAVAPQNGYPVTQQGMCQVALSPSNQPQVHLLPVNPPGLNLPGSEQPVQRAFKEAKTLGAAQILIGLIHIGLGSVMVTVVSGGYSAISLFGGFPFWGGIWFIVSGSLSVSAENQPQSSCLLNGSLGLNIISAICSVVGIILFITDLCLIPSYSYSVSYPPYYTWGVSPGVAISSVLLIFCLLEFCITCVSSHFGCQLVCSQHNYVGVVLPTVYVANPGVIPEPVNLPPTSSNQFQGSR